MSDPVKSPDHYNLGGFEVLDIMEALGWKESYLKANALKYLLRHERKGKPLEDLKKALFCIQKLIEQLEGPRTRMVQQKVAGTPKHKPLEGSSALPVVCQDPPDVCDGRYQFTPTTDIDPATEYGD